MTFKEIKELITLVSESNLKEFRMKEQEFEIKIRTDKDVTTQVISSMPVPAETLPPTTPVSSGAPAPAPAPAAPQGNEGDREKSSLIEIKSPMVGTFYRSPSPDKPSYVQVGDTIKTGSVVCIIEAMKLFNEIESEVAGKIVKVLVEDASPVEYDQVLFLVEPGA